MLTQTDLNLATPIFRLWDHADSLHADMQGNVQTYDFEANRWIARDPSYKDGILAAATFVAAAQFPELSDSELDAKLEELHDEWTQYKVAEAECRAEQRNAEATYGTMW